MLHPFHSRVVVTLSASFLALVACRTTTSHADVASAPIVAPARTPGIEGLGKIEFPNSGPEQAQDAFLRGMLLLHSFEYKDAAESFREAQTLAPEFALAYWGEALTYCHPIWQEEDLEASRAVLARLGPDAAARATKAGDERERALLAAAEILFGEGTRAERARAYRASLAELSARYPDDLEIASLYSLATLGSATQGRDIPTYMRAAAIAEAVLEKAPNHPGALHYAIHSYDDPVHAPLGLRMAHRYGVVAATAEHALHMPSHIYVALGQWEESVAANIAASAAADARRARKGLDVDARGTHSLTWLAYSYLQLGDVADAERLLLDMQRDAREKSSKRMRGALVDVRAAHVVALEEWDSDFASFEVAIDELEPARACAELYVRGRRALAQSDVARAQEVLASMAEFRGSLDTLPGAGATSAQCCSGDSPKNYLPDRLAARVMELELSGLIALATDGEKEGLTILHAAAELEDTMGFDFGPPVVVEPTHELLGVILLERGRVDEASREFEAALKRAPGRARSAQGLERARTATRQAAAR